MFVYCLFRLFICKLAEKTAGKPCLLCLHFLQVRDNILGAQGARTRTRAYICAFLMLLFLTMLVTHIGAWSLEDDIAVMVRASLKFFYRFPGRFIGTPGVYRCRSCLSFFLLLFCLFCLYCLLLFS